MFANVVNPSYDHYSNIVHISIVYEIKINFFNISTMHYISRAPGSIIIDISLTLQIQVTLPWVVLSWGCCYRNFAIVDVFFTIGNLNAIANLEFYNYLVQNKFCGVVLIHYYFIWNKPRRELIILKTEERYFLVVPFRI